MYRTGDRGRLLHDGALSLMGRLDREVKVRGMLLDKLCRTVLMLFEGYRIALGEIEDAIRRCDPAVTAASMQVSQDGTVLRAYVSPEDIDTEALRENLKSVLPSYMVPSVVTPLPSLPLNVNGKVDHKALHTANAVAPAMPKVTSRPVARPSVKSQQKPVQPALKVAAPPQPSKQLGSIIEAAWTKVIGLSTAPPEDANFFDVGGDR